VKAAVRVEGGKDAAVIAHKKTTFRKDAPREERVGTSRVGSTAHVPKQRRPMNALAPRRYVVAKLMWLAPLVLLAFGLVLAKTPYDFSRTLKQGYAATARVDSFITTNRSEISYDAVALVVPTTTGDSLRTTLPVPHSLFQILGDQTTLPVRVLEGSAQPVVIEATMVKDGRGGRQRFGLGTVQMRLAAIGAAICLVSALLLALPIFLWNRHLKRFGDPADRIA